MLAIVYFDYAYDFYTYNKDRRFLKLPAFDNEDELKSWVEETEKEIAKEICEKDYRNRNNVDVYITNIVRV